MHSHPMQMAPKNILPSSSEKQQSPVFLTRKQVSVGLLLSQQCKTMDDQCSSWAMAKMLGFRASGEAA